MVYYGTRAASKRGHPVLIYRNPKTELYYVFSVQKHDDNTEIAVCSFCRRLFNRLSDAERVRVGEPQSIEVRHYLEFGRNPKKISHFEGCSPVEDESLAKYSIVAKPIDDSLPYPVTMAMTVDNPVLVNFVYRFKDDPSKCYKFLAGSGQKKYRLMNGDFSMGCAGCKAVYVHANKHDKAKIATLATVVHRRTDGNTFLTDPMEKHIEGCEPWDYDHVMNRCAQVTEVVKQKLIAQQDISMHLPPVSFPFIFVPGGRLEKEDHFPARFVLSVRSPAISVIYFIPDRPFMCYTFTISKNTTLLKLARGEVFSVRCYGCKKCLDLRRQSQYTESAFSAKKMIRSSFLMDPTIGHIEGCKPKSSADIMKRYHLLIKDFYHNTGELSNYIDKSLPSSVTAPSTVAKTIEPLMDSSEAVSRMCSEVEELADDDDVICLPAPSCSTIGQESSRRDAKNTTLPSNDASSPFSPRTKEKGRLKSDDENIVIGAEPAGSRGKKRGRISENEADAPADLDVSSRSVSSTKKRRKYKESFDAFIFNENEVEVRLDGGKLTVAFERQSSAASIPNKKTSLSYESDLPADVNHDTLTWRWRDGRVVVKAKRH